MVGRAWRSKLVGMAHLSGPAPGPNPEAEPGGCRRGLCSDTGPPHSLPHSAPPTSNPVQHSSLQGVYLLGSKSHWEGVWKMCFSFQASLGRHSKGCVPQTLTCVCHEACRGLMPKCCGGHRELSSTQTPGMSLEGVGRWEQHLMAGCEAGFHLHYFSVFIPNNFRDI